MSFGSPPPAPALPPMPAAPAPPPAFGMVQGKKPGPKNIAATYLGTGDIANPVGPGSTNFGGKTLLGT